MQGCFERRKRNDSRVVSGHSQVGKSNTVTIAKQAQIELGFLSHDLVNFDSHPNFMITASEEEDEWSRLFRKVQGHSAPLSMR